MDFLKEFPGLEKLREELFKLSPRCTGSCTSACVIPVTEELRLPLWIDYPSSAPELEEVDKLIEKEMLKLKPGSKVDTRQFKGSKGILEEDYLQTLLSHHHLLPSGLLTFGPGLEVKNCLSNPKSCARTLSQITPEALLKIFPCRLGAESIEEDETIPGDEISLCPLQIVPVLVSGLASWLVLQGRTRHLLFSFPYAVCETKRFAMLQEVPVNPAVQNPPTLRFLPEFLASLFPGEVNEAGIPSFHFFKRVIYTVTLSILHTLFVCDEEFGMVFYDTSPDAFILSSHAFLGGREVQMGKEALTSEKEYKYAIDEERSLLLPNLGFLCKLKVDSPDASLYHLPLKKVRAMLWDRSDPALGYEWYLLGNLDPAYINKEVETVFSEEEKKGAKETLSLSAQKPTEENLVTETTRQLQEKLVVFDQVRKEVNAHYVNLGVRPTRRWPRGYDFQMFCGLLAQQVTEWYQKWNFSGSVLLTDTVLDYFHLKYGYFLVKETPSHLWPVSPGTILTHLIYDSENSQEEFILPYLPSEPSTVEWNELGDSKVYELALLCNTTPLEKVMKEYWKDPTMLYLLTCLDSLALVPNQEVAKGLSFYGETHNLGPITFPEDVSYETLGPSTQKALHRLIQLNNCVPSLRIATSFGQ